MNDSATETMIDVNEVIEAYIEAALWSTTDESDENGGEPMDLNYTKDDIDPESLQRIIVDCTQFVHDNIELIKAGNITSEMVGYDFWLTRNGHGCGFFDRDLGDIGDKLTDICDEWGELHPYVGDDGKIYF